MPFWVYILRCSDQSYYTGHTDDLEKRLAQHAHGEIEGYTSTRLPLKLVFSEEFPTREEALACEQQIKHWSRKKKESLMRRDWKDVSRLAHQKFERFLERSVRCPQLHSRIEHFKKLGMLRQAQHERNSMTT
jgi:predicted GIY-YIG superfamily endonuclease